MHDEAAKNIISKGRIYSGGDYLMVFLHRTENHKTENLSLYKRRRYKQRRISKLLVTVYCSSKFSFKKIKKQKSMGIKENLFTSKITL